MYRKRQALGNMFPLHYLNHNIQNENFHSSNRYNENVILQGRHNF